MFANIRKHQKWLWILISGAVIISFVWYFNPNSSNGAASVFGGDPTMGTMSGRAIKRAEIMENRREAMMLYFFTRGSWPGSDEFSRGAETQIEQEAKNRMVLKQKINELQIHVTEKEVASWMAEFFGGPQGRFEPGDYDRLLKMLEEKGIRETDLTKFAKAQVGIMHMASVAGASGRLVTPQEAEAEYRRENEQASVDAVFFTSSNYLAQVKLDPALLTTYFTNMLADYIEPKKVIVTYVVFEATNYFADADKIIAGITNLSMRIDEAYVQRGTNYYTDTNGVAMTPEAAKTKIREEIRHSQALVAARKAAIDFAQALFDLPGARQVANLENLAANKGLATKTTEAFSQFEGPKGLDMPERFTQAAFNLTVGDPFIEEPVVGNDGVYVVGLKGQVERRTPKFDEVKDRVTEAYKRANSQTLAAAAGQAFRASLTNALASGKAFSAVVTELGEKAVNLPPFTQAARMLPGLDPRADLSQVKNMAFSLRAGETSGFVRSRDGGFILHVNKFIPAADDAVKNALPDYITQLQRSGQGEAFSEWFSKQLQLANVKFVTDNNAGAMDLGADGEDHTGHDHAKDPH